MDVPLSGGESLVHSLDGNSGISLNGVCFQRLVSQDLSSVSLLKNHGSLPHLLKCFALGFSSVQGLGFSCSMFQSNIGASLYESSVC